METLSSNFIVSSASATGSGRSKVVLKPGHSLMDWIRYTHSGRDLTSTGGKILEVSSRELAKHNTKDDAWIALKGKVYNITPYLDFHPGGVEELMRGAGKDATDLFNQVHQWVNAESMLQKCFVGVLKKSWSLDGIPKFTKPLKKPKSPKTVIESTIPLLSATEKENKVLNKTSEWNKVSNGVSESNGIAIRIYKEDNKMILTLSSSSITYNEVITCLKQETLLIKYNKDFTSWLIIRFPKIFKSDYAVQALEAKEKNTVKFIFECSKESFVTECKTSLLWKLSDKVENIFWPCKLSEKCALNYNTFLFTFLLPPNVKMWVPVGGHVFVKSEIEGVEIVRSYTPIIPSLDTKEENDSFSGSCVVLMIKIYPSGTLTPLLNMYNIGESVLISSYAGTFSETALYPFNSVVMLAAGTGITPMIKVIYWTLTAKDKKRSLLLLFFNKTEEDILWKAEFENCEKTHENFKVINILSDSDHKWSGFTGRISDDIVKQLVPPNTLNNQLILICGPLPFTNSALRIFEKSGYRQESIYAFTG